MLPSAMRTIVSITDICPSSGLRIRFSVAGIVRLLNKFHRGVLVGIRPAGHERAKDGPLVLAKHEPSRQAIAEEAHVNVVAELLEVESKLHLCLSSLC